MIECGKENKMYKFTYQVLDFNADDRKFVILVKTTDAKVEKQEEIIHIGYDEDQITETDFKERIHKEVQHQLWPKWRRQNNPSNSPPVGTESFMGKSYEFEYDYATNKIWEEPVFSSVDDPWEDLISDEDIE